LPDRSFGLLDGSILCLSILYRPLQVELADRTRALPLKIEGDLFLNLREFIDGF
jgi:hypothetical protein